MIFNLKNITVRQLFELDEHEFAKYMTLKDCLKSKNEFDGKKGIEISSLTFAEVSEIKRIFFQPTFEGLFETFERIFKTDRHRFLRSDVISYFYALNYIGESVQKIIKNERLLSPDDDEEAFLMKEAGAERLKVFQELPVLLNLARSFGTTVQEVENWKYSLVFSILLHDKIQADVRKKFDELKKSQSK